jgi:hypothetical protein
MEMGDKFLSHTALFNAQVVDWARGGSGTYDVIKNSCLLWEPNSHYLATTQSLY